MRPKGVRIRNNAHPGHHPPPHHFHQHHNLYTTYHQHHNLCTTYHQHHNLYSIHPSHCPPDWGRAKFAKTRTTQTHTITMLTTLLTTHHAQHTALHSPCSLLPMLTAPIAHRSPCSPSPCSPPPLPMLASHHSSNYTLFLAYNCL